LAGEKCNWTSHGDRWPFWGFAGKVLCADSGWARLPAEWHDCRSQTSIKIEGGRRPVNGLLREFRRSTIRMISADLNPDTSANVKVSLSISFDGRSLLSFRRRSI
jgi:hypothetical protein